jgi:hypothetical protein
MWIDVLNHGVQNRPERLPELLARHGRVAEAEQVANDLVFPTAQAKALIDIANTLSDGHDRRRDLMASVDDLVRHDMSVEEIAELATTLSSVDLLDRAVQEAEGIADERERRWDLVRCAWAAAALCPIDYVQRIGVAAGGADNVAAAMAAALARAGRIDEGEQLVARLRSDPESPAQYGVTELVEVFATQFGRLGDVGLINNMLEGLDSARESAVALAAFAEGVASIAEPDDLREILVFAADAARAVEPTFDREVTRSRVATAAAALRQPDYAVQILADHDARSGSLADVVEALTGAGGEPEIALEIADSITDRDSQARALVAIALATQDHQRAGELLARIDRLMAESVDLGSTAVQLAVAARHDHRDSAVRLALQAEQFAAREQNDPTRRFVMDSVVGLMLAIGAELTPGQLAWIEQNAEWLEQAPRQTVINHAVHSPARGDFRGGCGPGPTHPGTSGDRRHPRNGDRNRSRRG